MFVLMCLENFSELFSPSSHRFTGEADQSLIPWILFSFRSPDAAANFSPILKKE